MTDAELGEFINALGCHEETGWTPAQAQAAQAAVASDAKASGLPWGWVLRAAVVVVPITIALSWAADRLGWCGWGAQC